MTFTLCMLTFLYVCFLINHTTFSWAIFYLFCLTFIIIVTHSYSTIIIHVHINTFKSVSHKNERLYKHNVIQVEYK